MSVGTNIKQLRDRAGMTQEELADKLKIGIKMRVNRHRPHRAIMLQHSP